MSDIPKSMEYSVLRGIVWSQLGRMDRRRECNHILVMTDGMTLTYDSSMRDLSDYMKYHDTDDNALAVDCHNIVSASAIHTDRDDVAVWTELFGKLSDYDDGFITKSPYLRYTVRDLWQVRDGNIDLLRFTTRDGWHVLCSVDPGTCSPIRSIAMNTELLTYYGEDGTAMKELFRRFDSYIPRHNTSSESQTLVRMLNEHGFTQPAAMLDEVARVSALLDRSYKLRTIIEVYKQDFGWKE
ncbi:MAG: hypothetical protein NC548_11190 [Lachnospiraceae bacterium]|nr:hypothetical protein [Lachnospiraceae bacterium]